MGVVGPLIDRTTGVIGQHLIEQRRAHNACLVILIEQIVDEQRGFPRARIIDSGRIGNAEGVEGYPVSEAAVRVSTSPCQA
jgi:hypothetical protein